MRVASPSGSARPAGLLGMLVLVLLIEAILGRGDRIASDKAESWRFAGRAAVREAPGCEILLLGDSMVKFGLLPGVIEDRLGTGARVYNLAAFDGPPAASDVLLRRALDAGARPRAVVVNLMPHQLARSPLDPAWRRAWSELLTFRESLVVASALGLPELPASTMMGRLLPSIRARDELRANLIAAIDGNNRSARNIVRLYHRNWMANRGAHVLAERDEPGQVDPANVDLFPSRWEPDPAALASVRRLLSLARSHGIHVYWLVSPLHPEAQDRHRLDGLEATYNHLVSELVAEFPGVTILDGRGLGIDASRFADAVHLDRTGAVNLSYAVADALAAGSNGGWMDLARPMPIGGPRVIAVEDLNQSRIHLLDEHATRRR